MDLRQREQLVEDRRVVRQQRPAAGRAGAGTGLLVPQLLGDVVARPGPGRSPAAAPARDADPVAASTRVSSSRRSRTSSADRPCRAVRRADLEACSTSPSRSRSRRDSLSAADTLRSASSARAAAARLDGLARPGVGGRGVAPGVGDAAAQRGVLGPCLGEQRALLVEGDTALRAQGVQLLTQPYGFQLGATTGPGRRLEDLRGGRDTRSSQPGDRST